MPTLIVGGAPEKVDKVRARVPDAHMDEGELLSTLAPLLRRDE